MSCEHCGDKGIAIQEWTDEPPDFAVCVCGAGQAWRRAESWRIWCAQWQVDPSRVFMLEDIYTPQELATAGLVVGKAHTMSREYLLLKAARQRK